MPQVSLLPPLRGLGGRLCPREPQAWVAAGPHGQEVSYVGRGLAGRRSQGSRAGSEAGPGPAAGRGRQAGPFIIRMEGGGEGRQREGGIGRGGGEQAEGCHN